MNKDDIRRQVKARKALLSDDEKSGAARRAFEFVERTAAFMLSDHILMYHSMADELSTREFISKWNTRKKFYLPRVNGVNLDILPYDKSRLHLGAFNIEEPDGDDLTDISDIELIIVPGVAFDRHGNRIGRGKGFYDRLLRNTKATTIGIAYNCQIYNDFEPDEFDIPVHYVITDHEVIKIK